MRSHVDELLEVLAWLIAWNKSMICISHYRTLFVDLERFKISMRFVACLC